MDMNDLVLVSVDDHLVEPPDLFDQHIPAKYADDVPKLIQRADGTDAWVFEGQEATNVGLNAVAGRPPDEYGAEPTKLSEIREGCYDVHQRIRDMNANGVAAALNFPSFPQFCGQYFARAKDKDLGLAVLRAYNDWHIDEWCGTYPGRMIPQALPPIWDPQLMAEEVHRVAKKGCHAVSFSENPTKIDYPSLHDPHWDPFWQACCDENTVVNLHIGSSSSVVITSVDAPIDVMITLQPINIVQAAADLIWSPAVRKFPDLRFALSEGGIGWVPYFLERIDRVYKMHKAWTHQDFGGKLPSEVFLERVALCFIDDAFGVEARDHLNLDMVNWECDYPHSDSTWPLAPESLHSYLEGVPDSDIDKITHENALRLYSFDMFGKADKRDLTVGALRAQAGDVDLGYRSSARLKKTGSDTVTVMDLARQLPAAAE
ncbi:MAG: amidohydrolase [Nocardia sp.]|nr:amidohydrolase [Nocardia sp.]